MSIPDMPLGDADAEADIRGVAMTGMPVEDEDAAPVLEAELEHAAAAEATTAVSSAATTSRGQGNVNV